jgi:hypothetical protein
LLCLCIVAFQPSKLLYKVSYFYPLWCGDFEIRLYR